MVGRADLEAAVGAQPRVDQQHLAVLAHGDGLTGLVDQHPAAVAGQPPRLDHGGLQLLAAAGLHGEATQLGEGERRRVGHGAIVSGDSAGDRPLRSARGLPAAEPPRARPRHLARGARQERMRPLVRHFAEVGFGTPDVVVLIYVVKIALYVLVGWLLVLTTPGIDGFTAVADWWRDPIVFYKAVRLDDALRGARPRLRLRPAQPAVPARRSARSSTGCGPGPSGSRRGRAGCRSPAATPGRSSTSCSTPRCVVSLVVRASSAPLPRLAGLPSVARCCSPLIGLRDKTIFLAARSEVYGDARGHLPLRRPATRCVGGQARHGRDLVGRGDLQAQPALPVRRRRR